MQTVSFSSEHAFLQGHLYLTSEKAPTLVLLHGLCFYSFVYERLAPLLAETGYNCFCFDFRCHGQSQGRRGYWTMEAFVRDIQSALDYLEGRGLHHFGLFGNSMGATAAVYAAACDKRIHSLAACNPATKPAEALFSPFRKKFLSITHALASYVPFRIPATLFMPETLVLDEEENIRRVRFDPYIRAARWISPSSYQDLYHWDAEAQVKKISCPLLVLRSKRDRLQPQSESERLFAAARAPKELQRIDASHVPNWEEPEKMHQILHAWFNETL